MANENDKPVISWDDQLRFPFLGKTEYPVEYVGETLQGYGLYRRKAEHGGYVYFTDETGLPTLVYDEGISNVLAMFEALEHLGCGKEMWEMIGASLNYTQKR